MSLKLLLIRIRYAVAVRFHNLTRKVDFWSLDRRWEASPFVDWKRPGLSRYELRNAIEAVVPVNTLVRNFSLMVFHSNREFTDSLMIDTESKPLRQLVQYAFLERRYTDPPIGIFQAHRLEDLFEVIVRHLMVHGNVALVAVWNNPDEWRFRQQLPQFRLTFQSNLKKVRLESGADGYEIQVLRSWPNGDLESLHVDSRDVIFFEWPLNPRMDWRKAGVSPVDRVVRSFKQRDRLMETQLTITQAHTVSDQHSFRMERARWQDLSKVISRYKSADLTIHGELYGLITDRPLTKYYDVYQVLKYYERGAIVREYLISQFNHMIGRFSLLASFQDPARLEPVGYIRSQEIQRLIRQFTNGEISGEEAASEVRGRSA